MEGMSREEKDRDGKALAENISELADMSFGPDWAPGKGKSLESKGTANPTPVTSTTHMAQARGPRPKDTAKRAHRAASKSVFTPVVDVLFYPEKAAFQRLVDALRSSSKTYQLFEIARLILEKPERFTVTLKPLKEEDSVTPKLYSAVPDRVPFKTANEAIDHVCRHHLDQFFEVTIEEREPPKGNFLFINRCPLTQELIGPPNYHQYSQLLEEHYASKVSGKIGYEPFLKRIETIKEPEALKEWLEKMRKIRRYKIKNPEPGETTEFDSLEGVRRFLGTRLREKVVREGDQLRLESKDIKGLPKGDIRRSIETALERQQRFPLDTAVHLRTLLQRKHFCIYKKGAKATHYACAVKRKFRDRTTTFTDTIQTLIEYIEQHPMIGVAELQEKLLQPSQSSEKATQAAALQQDLNWLIREGYVAEYTNGTLFAWRPRKEAPTIPAKKPGRQFKKKSVKATTAPVPAPPIAPDVSNVPVAPLGSNDPDQTPKPS